MGLLKTEYSKRVQQIEEYTSKLFLDHPTLLNEALCDVIINTTVRRVEDSIDLESEIDEAREMLLEKIQDIPGKT